MWKEIPGYKNPYRIDENGTVQQFTRGKWVTVTPYVTRSRAEVRLRGLDGKQKHVGIFRLLDLCFMRGYGEKNGLSIGPKNGMKSDCAIENMMYQTKSDVGKKSFSRARKRIVIRHDKDGNQTVYKSVEEAARKNGLTRASLDRRAYHGVLDPRGYRWEILK